MINSKVIIFNQKAKGRDIQLLREPYKVRKKIVWKRFRGEDTRHWTPFSLRSTRAGFSLSPSRLTRFRGDYTRQKGTRPPFSLPLSSPTTRSWVCYQDHRGKVRKNERCNEIEGIIADWKPHFPEEKSWEICFVLFPLPATDVRTAFPFFFSLYGSLNGILFRD